mgnify:FL=1|jgi:hypothetical protein
MSLIEQVCCVSVKILCENKDKTDSSLGTGTIISDGDSYYVMTAGHCIKNSHDIVFDIDDIKIISYAKNTPQELSLLEIVKLDLTEENDFALLRIEKPNIDFDFFNNIKRCDDILDEENYFFYGFNDKADTGRKYELQRNGKARWHLINDIIVNQPLTAEDIMGGNSGAGVFFRKLDIYYYVGYVKRLFDEDGNQNDIIIYPASRFDDILAPVTKEVNFFNLVDKWTELENKEIDEELKKIYQKENVLYLNNLKRKMDVLFSHPEEAQDNYNSYLDHYFRGLSLNSEINKTPYIAEKLRNKDLKVFKNCQELRSKYFSADKDARDDLKEIRNQIIKAASDILYTDDKEQTLSKVYANYSIAEKLLICSLDYKDTL